MTEPVASTHPNGDIEKLAQLVTLIARSLVDAPDEVSLGAVEQNDVVLLRLKLAAGDVGKLVGRQGRTARSLRTILAAASAKAKRRFSLDIVEPR